MSMRSAITTFVAAILAWPSLGLAAPRASELSPPAAAHLPAKPTGPIAVEYRVAAAPTVGAPLEIDVSARVEPGVKSLSIEANASAPHAVLLTPPTVVAAGDGVFAWKITVVPLAAEAGYLSVIVAGRVDGVAQARAVTVPLRSSAAAGPTPAAEAAGPEALNSLPVKETPLSAHKRELSHGA
jgi:hypothetical protein